MAIGKQCSERREWKHKGRRDGKCNLECACEGYGKGKVKPNLTKAKMQ